MAPKRERLIHWTGNTLLEPGDCFRAVDETHLEVIAPVPRDSIILSGAEVVLDHTGRRYVNKAGQPYVRDRRYYAKILAGQVQPSPRYFPDVFLDMRDPQNRAHAIESVAARQRRFDDPLEDLERFVTGLTASYESGPTAPPES